jgi:hypothetical protein
MATNYACKSSDMATGNETPVSEVPLR